ncbi:hypothetical protein [Enterococcus timonensis]|uniref:hypothetical protein n=1 Tax=Enterococcus timonensis TaxID=1852364 RepID=UPI0008D8F6D7|nr:hypothetical protein [Enterococcus timonensis]
MNTPLSLDGKNILLLAPKFFGYEKMLQKALEKLGAQVTFYDERPSNSTAGKAMLRINPRLMQDQIKKYYQKILSDTADFSFDHILICQGEATPIFFLEELANYFPKSFKTLYFWDSMENKIHNREKAAYFDLVSSFDYQDCQKYGWHFRPLFFDTSYETLQKSEQNVLDLFFVGTIHSDRFIILEQIKKAFLAEKRSVFFYYFIPSKLMFYYYKYLKKIIPNAQLNDFHYQALNKDVLQEKLAAAKTVVDIQHPAQSGLTMRTIEMLGAKKKLITTNSDVVHYDFYRSENICVVDRTDVQVPENFLRSTYQEIPEEVYRRYDIHYFVCELLGIVTGGNYHD